MEIIRKLLSGKKIAYEGNIYKIKAARLNFIEDRKIPVYIGAQGPKMLTLAGAIGDGVLINASHPLDFKEALPLLVHGGADLSHFDVGAYTSFSVAKNRDDAVKAAKPVVAFIVAGSPDPVFERHGIDMKDVNAVRSGFRKRFADAVSAVTEEMMEAFSICGTPGECTEKIDGLIKAGVTQVVAGSPIGPDREKAIKIVGKGIMPYF